MGGGWAWVGGVGVSGGSHVMCVYLIPRYLLEREEPRLWARAHALPVGRWGFDAWLVYLLRPLGCVDDGGMGHACCLGDPREGNPSTPGLDHELWDGSLVGVRPVDHS